MSFFASAQLQRNYTVRNWTLTSRNWYGTISTSTLQNGITLIVPSYHCGTYENTLYTITVPSPTQITFDWNCSTHDNSFFDFSSIVGNGIQVPLMDLKLTRLILLL